MRSLADLIFIIATSILLVSCKVGPDFHSPPPPDLSSYTRLPMPQQTASVSQAGPGKAQYFNMGANIPGEWWQLFHCPAVKALIKAGLENSPTLAAALATLQKAQQTLRATVGNLLFPSVDLQALAERTRSSSFGGGSGASSAAGASAGSAGGGESSSSIFNIYYTAANVSYTLDLFGGLRRQVEAIRAQVDFARYQYLAAYLSLTSNIVTTAITVATVESEIHSTRELIQEFAEQLKIVTEHLQLGSASQEDVLLQQTQVSQTQALLPPLLVQLSQARHALAVLIGEFPSNSHLPALHLSSINLPGNIPLSVPSKLVK